MKIAHSLIVAGALLSGTGAANAGVVEELRLGVMQHNICITDCKNADKEDGPNVSAEIVFGSPDFLSWAFSPRPYLNASINTAGNTNFGTAGLQWSFDLTDTLSIAPGIGYTIHDGELANPYPNATAQAAAFSDAHVLLGSRDLFRSSLALHWQFDENWGAEALYEHYSHGQILGSGRNQGMDNIGVRLSYKFGE